MHAWETRTLKHLNKGGHSGINGEMRREESADIDYILSPSAQGGTQSLARVAVAGISFSP